MSSLPSFPLVPGAPSSGGLSGGALRTSIPRDRNGTSGWTGRRLRHRVWLAKRRLGLTWAEVAAQIGVTDRTLRDLGKHPARVRTLTAIARWVNANLEPRLRTRRIRV